MRVRMLANVGLWEPGQEYDLPDEQAAAYVRQDYAEEVRPVRPKPVEQEPAKPAGKPGGRRQAKAVRQAPKNKAAAMATESKER